MNYIKQFFIRYFPSTGIFLRYILAFRDHFLPEKKSYSQAGEDAFIEEQLEGKDLSGGIYMDVGANHPSRISNTYKFYRKGLRGITIEPNSELIRLHKIFRSRDIALNIGAGKESYIGKLSISSTPVLSSFSKESKIRPSNTKPKVKEAYIPIMTLDSAIIDQAIKFIFFLNIDVEGMELDVLIGAEQVLKRSWYVCVESNEQDQSQAITSFLTARKFIFLKQIGCNFIFKNAGIH